MEAYILSLLLVLAYIVNTASAAHFRVICAPYDYGGSGVTVNIDGTAYEMKSENNDILYEYIYEGTPTNYYYSVTGAQSQDELTLFGSPRTWDSKSSTTLFEVFGRRYTVGDEFLKTIPRLYPPLEGYEKYSLLFQEGEIPVINIHMNPSDYSHLVSMTRNENLDIKIDFDFYTPYEKLTYTGASLSLSGQGSRNQEKKPYKIDLEKKDETGSNKTNSKIFGRKEFKLRSIRYDPSAIKNKFAGDIAESLGLPIAQSAPCRLYINNKSYGLYEIADLYKKKFVKRFFNPEKLANGDYNYGSLYKGVSGDYPALFYSDVGNSSFKDLYESIVEPTDGYDPHEDVLNMIKWAESISPTASKAEIEKQFDIDMFMKYAIIEYLICQWDGYLYNGNNFLTYIEPHNGKYHFFSYDFDLTFGKWCEAKTGTFDDFITHTQDTHHQKYGPNGEPRRDPLLYTKVIQNPNIKPEFEKLIKDISANLFNMNALGPRIDYFYKFLKDDLYWDIFCYNIIETRKFEGTGGQNLPTYKEVEAQFSDNADEENFKSYLNFKTKNVAQAYGVTEAKADNRYGTVGGKIVNIKNDDDDDTGSNLTSSDSNSNCITKYAFSSVIALISILLIWIMN